MDTPWICIGSTVLCFCGSDVQWRTFDLHRSRYRILITFISFHFTVPKEREWNDTKNMYFSSMDLYGPGSVLFSKKLLQRDDVQGNDVR